MGYPMSATVASVAGAPMLQVGLSGWEVMQIPEPPATINDVGVKYVARCFPRLSTLRLTRCPFLRHPLDWIGEYSPPPQPPEQQAVAPLYQPDANLLQHLTELHLTRCFSLLPAEFGAFMTYLPSLEHVHLEHMFREPPRGCAHIGAQACDLLELQAAQNLNGHEALGVAAAIDEPVVLEPQPLAPQLPAPPASTSSGSTLGALLQQDDQRPFRVTRGRSRMMQQVNQQSGLFSPPSSSSSTAAANESGCRLESLSLLEYQSFSEKERRGVRKRIHFEGWSQGTQTEQRAKALGGSGGRDLASPVATSQQTASSASSSIGVSTGDNALPSAAATSPATVSLVHRTLYSSVPVSPYCGASDCSHTYCNLLLINYVLSFESSQATASLTSVGAIASPEPVRRQFQHDLSSHLFRLLRKRQQRALHQQQHSSLSLSPSTVRPLASRTRSSRQSAAVVTCSPNAATVSLVKRSFATSSCASSSTCTSSSSHHLPPAKKRRSGRTHAYTVSVRDQSTSTSDLVFETDPPVFVCNAF